MPTILVVDDTPTNLEIIGALLGGLYKIKAAISGERALKLLEDTKLPDLILLDVMMPGMSGWEVCTAVKSNPRTKDIPVIFLTSKIELADETKGFELGAVDYITKPINPLTLHARVKTHIALQSALHRLKDHNQSLEKEVDSKGQEIALKDQELQNLNKLKRFFSAPIAQQILHLGETIY
jgi:putative two-component system response regulator